MERYLIAYIETANIVEDSSGLARNLSPGVMYNVKMMHATS
jgi:hypothetical protein